MNVPILLGQSTVAGFIYAFTSITGIILCLHYILENNWFSGVVFAIGVVLVQIFWGVFASLAFVLPAVTSHIEPKWFSLMGAVVLFVMAYLLFRAKVSTTITPKHAAAIRSFKMFFIGVVISLPFVVRIVGYMGLFATLGVHRTTSTLFDIITISLGVGLGAAIWWLGFTLIVACFRSRVTAHSLLILNKASAVLFIVLGAVSLWPVFN
ncbi:MAG: LysE family translocator [Gammaproteobacteria bacterium]|nr:LysE family translocator [Gammaproteobacteria bacterium]MBU2546224.1 LysE family translocator [Gammaproteobacteria bacterium]